MDHPFWDNKRVCVTGGTGFLGRHLVEQLLAAGARVRVLALPARDGQPSPWADRVEMFPGSVLDRPLVRRALAGCDVVIHTAGIVATWGAGLQLMHRVHVEGTRTVLDEAPADARIIHTSSVVAVGASSRPEVLTEDSPFTLDQFPVDYVHAKRRAEELALEAARAGQRVIVVNPGYLIGPGDHERSVLGEICLRFWKGRLFVALPGGFSVVDVRDVALGHLLAAERGVPGRRYILAGVNLTMRQLLTHLARVANMRPRGLVPMPGWLLQSLATVASWRAARKGKAPYPTPQAARVNRLYWFHDSARARAELGYRSRPLDETLRDTHEWFTQQKLVFLRGLHRWWMRPKAA